MGISWAELLGIAVGLSMDAFAVSLCKGLATGRTRAKHMLLAGAWFGLFQALMPAAGYWLGTRFEDLIARAAPWVAFALLALIGANMLREAFSGKEESQDASYAPRTMLALAVATSIDALATGVAFAATETGTAAAPGPSGIWTAVLVIGAATFALSALGIRLGGHFGDRYGRRAKILGGVVLVSIGLKILLEHLLG